MAQRGADPYDQPRGLGSSLTVSSRAPSRSAIAMAREMVDRDYVVALFHLVRVVIVFVSTPMLLGLIEGQQAVDRSNTALLTMPSIFSLPATDIVTFVGLGLFGWFLAKWGRVPMPHLIGPVGISTLFHLMGWAELPRGQ